MITIKLSHTPVEIGVLSIIDYNFFDARFRILPDYIKL